ncbi:PRD domain-containing protein, partial [Micrococcus sp. SIMBA_144]
AEVKTLIHQALDSIHERYTIQLDEIGFYEESRHHFLLMMNRLKLGIELKQVLYMEHKQDYSFSHTLSLEFRTVMEALYSLKINDAEIDYITIYIRLYLDRIFKVNDIDKINIVCRSGKG